MGKAEDFFKKLADAKKSSNGGNYIKHGVSELEVKRIEMKESTNPDTLGKMFFIVEYETLTFVGGKYVNKLGITEDTTGLYQKGSIVSDPINLEDPYGNGLPNAKKLAACILASKHDAKYEDVWEKIDEDDLKALCGPDQPGTGARVKCAAANIVTKRTKNDFTTKHYEPLPAASGQKAA